MSMKFRLAIAALLVAPLPACATLAPVAVADRTTVDEKAAIGFELAYTAASRAGTSLARAGIIDPAEFVALDARAYAALLSVRAAYRTGNARDIASAAAELEAAIGAMNAALERSR